MMVKIQIDRKLYEVQEGKNLLDTCLTLGFDIPHFCYHPALGSVGACRLCAVKKYKDDADKKGRIVMSCMEPVKDGLIVSLEDAEVKEFRAAVLESLMTNHPLDCPVCDEGGECHLQDMTVMTGHNYRRYNFKKRTYTNQYLGPFINHEMNRCIQCYRCVRFYKDYAGGKDLNVFAAHHHVYFGRHEEGVLESEFSGNLVEVCPTGVFTDKTLKKHYTRKWDLTNSPSVCIHCSVGCNTILSERNGILRRVMNRYNGSVNGYFICDRGRFGYEFVNDPLRIHKILMRSAKDKKLEITGFENIKKVIQSIFSEGSKIIGIGSPRASLEANYALSVLTGKENFYHGISDQDQSLVKTALSILKNSMAHVPSLKDLEKADAVFILGEDVTNTAPMVALALRQASKSVGIEMAVKAGISGWHDYAVRDKADELKSPVFIATTCRTKLDEIAKSTFHAAEKDIARLGFAVASIIDSRAPVVKGLSKAEQDEAKMIAAALLNAKRPLVVSGTHSGSEDILHAAANITKALLSQQKKSALSIIVPESNSLGLVMMEGKSLDDAIALSKQTEVDILIILENDLYRRADKESIDRLFRKCKQVIVLDHLMSLTSQAADIVIPVGTFAESQGTLVNNEGRAQRYYNVFPVKEPVFESWRWMKELMQFSGKHGTSSWQDFESVVSDMISSNPEFDKIKNIIPEADFSRLNEKIPRQTQRFSGRTAIHAHESVREQAIPQDNDSPLAFSMEGYNGKPPAAIIPYYWSPGWNSVQATYKYLDQPNGHMKDGDPGIRLFEDNTQSSLDYFDSIPSAFQPKNNEWWVVPLYHIFGSEELSAKGNAIAQRIQTPDILMNRTEAETYGLKENTKIQITSVIQNIDFSVKVSDSVPLGVVCVSHNLPGMLYSPVPGWSQLKK